MQFDLSRAFPYPVLRPDVDDYVDSDIQTAAKFEHVDGNKELTADIEFTLSVEEIKNLANSGLADYVAVFACRDTYFRRAVRSSNPCFQATFPAGALRGQVIVYPFIIASADVEAFDCAWINSEFGTGPFSFPVGAVLALDKPQSVYIDRDNFKPISSCFVLVRDNNLPENEWRVRADGPKVCIVVSGSLKELISTARNSRENRAILLNSLYFSAVTQCICLLKAEEDLDGYRWAQIFQQRIRAEGIDLKTEPETAVAQRLMRRPISLLNNYFFRSKAE